MKNDGPLRKLEIVMHAECKTDLRPCEWCGQLTAWLYIENGQKVRACRPRHAEKAMRNGKVGPTAAAAAGESGVHD